MQHTFPAARLDLEDVEVTVLFLENATAQDRANLHRAGENSVPGNVVSVWRDTFGRTCFLAPPEQHPFFQIAGYDQLLAQVDRTISIDLS
jgi:hypothetical protein